MKIAGAHLQYIHMTDIQKILIKSVKRNSRESPKYLYLQTNGWTDKANPAYPITSLREYLCYSNSFSVISSPISFNYIDLIM
jgi:hypothetical protein